METTLSQWQDPETGYPADAYQDAVIVALEAIGIGVHDSWRDEPWDFVIELDRAAFAGKIRTADLHVGWRVSEESDPLAEGDDDGWHGFHGVAQITGWWWITDQGNAIGFSDPNDPRCQLAPLAEPGDVAAAVAILLLEH